MPPLLLAEPLYGKYGHYTCGGGVENVARRRLEEGPHGREEMRSSSPPPATSFYQDRYNSYSR